MSLQSTFKPALNFAIQLAFYFVEAYLQINIESDVFSPERVHEYKQTYISVFKFIAVDASFVIGRNWTIHINKWQPTNTATKTSNDC